MGEYQAANEIREHRKLKFASARHERHEPPMTSGVWGSVICRCVSVGMCSM